MTSAAIYARVSSTRQKKDQTIASQPASLRAQREEQQTTAAEGQKAMKKDGQQA